jgi:hypothetical protein
MTVQFISKTNIYCLLACVLYLGSFAMYGDTTSLKLCKKSILTVSINSIKFRGIASNGATYEAGLSCFRSDQNSSGYQQGNLRVLRSEYHVGADTIFSYTDCIHMKKALQEGTENLLLSWDQESFDNFISAKLNYQRILMTNPSDI